MTTSDDHRPVEWPEGSDEEIPEGPFDDEGRLFILRMLYDGLCNRGGDTFPVVLEVGGTVVTGTAVSYEQWLRAVSATPTPGRPGSISDLLHDLADKAAAQPEKPEAEELRHINLVDATVHIGGTTKFNVPAWQVPFARISGWTPGAPDAPPAQV